MIFASRVSVCSADGVLLYHTHRNDAVRLVRDGLAERATKVRVNLLSCSPGKDGRKAFGNPHKYTFVESLGSPTVAHCQSLKLHVADQRNWPMYRAALVDCLPTEKRAQIRALFAPKQKKAAA